MRYHTLVAIGILAAGLTWAGCSSEEKTPPAPPKPPANVAPTPPPQPPGGGADGEPAPAPMSRPVSTPSAEELMAKWHEIAQGDPEQIDVASAIGLAQQLAADGPEGLKPLLDILADPDADPQSKMVATMSLTPVLGTMTDPAAREDLAAQLIAYSQSDQETTTRASAATLLGVINTPKAQARSVELTEDKNIRVRGAAIIALAMRGDEDAIGKLRGLWEDEEATKAQREQVVRVLPQRLVADNVDLLVEAVTGTEMQAGYRYKAAGMLGQTTDPRALEALRAAAENDPNARVREIASAAADAVAARLDRSEGEGAQASEQN